MSKELNGIVKAWEATFRKKRAPVKKKRVGSIFAIMSVAHVDDDLDIPGELYHEEKVLDNGDMYTGQLADSCPNGHGKFLWSDGCMYVGEWVKGKINGKGKFSWPSGATYEGQFKNGYMDGEGTYTGSSNEYYRGAWVFNMKHGKGAQNYANGDYYEGNWRRGRPGGHGRYQWQNGNQYIGEWKHGKMNGNGTMIWTNGNRYDGCWEDGLPKGNGTYRWVDGRFYVGVWSQDPKEMNGTYYPSTSSVGQLDWDPRELFLNDLRECKISRGEKILVFPSRKMADWPCDGEHLRTTTIGKSPKTNDPMFRKASADGRFSSGGYSWDSESDIGSEANGCLGSAREAQERFESSRSDDHYITRGIRHDAIKIQPPKRQGKTITKGHRNYELMLNLQLGIRHSVGRSASVQSLDLKSTAFDTREKIWTKFPPEGSKYTPPHQSCEFKWKDYCPLVFRTLRQLFKVDPADYMISLCGNDALRELSSPGKSGSFFYLTNDDKYMIKTVKKAEAKVLLRMLPAYHNHVRAFDNTLITKFFGLHCVKLTGPAQKKVRFIITGNLFCTEHPIHRCYDLKGSSIGRVTSKPESEITSRTTLKDLDLNFIFRLQKVWFQEFCRQVDRDCDFLEQERIMDYSLLLGIHFREVSGTGEPVPAESLSSEARSPGWDGTSEGATPRLSRADMDLLSDPSRWASIRLGVNIPARAELTVRKDELELIGEPTGEKYDVILVFGIIDILQAYDVSKKLEHAYKSMQYDPTSISAVDPRQYSRRFRDFMFRAFTEDG